jgi:hypothetical protein
MQLWNEAEEDLKFALCRLPNSTLIKAELKKVERALQEATATSLPGKKLPPPPPPPARPRFLSLPLVLPLSLSL